MNWLSNLADAKTDVLLPAAVAALVSMLVGVLRTRWELRDRLSAEYEHDQRKKLRELIGGYHGRLMNACVSLNHRIWNLYTNVGAKWHCTRGNYHDPGYYLQSTVHRLLTVCALVRRFENEALMLDARVASESDFVFVRFIKGLQWVLTDVALFQGMDYDSSHQSDHFFSDNLREYCDAVLVDGIVLTSGQLAEFTTTDRRLDPVFAFFDGIAPTENRLRWDRLVALHLVLMAFINTFGYDVDVSEAHHFNKAVSKFRSEAVAQNLVSGLTRLKVAGSSGGKLIARSVRRARETEPNPPL